MDISRTHFGKRCISVGASSADSTRLKLSFSDGSSAEADVVLGADGIRSSVRNFILDEDESSGIENKGLRNAVFSNTVAYRGLVPMEHLKGLLQLQPTYKRPVCWIGPGKVSSAIVFEVQDE